jgi:hypothetical protein
MRVAEVGLESDLYRSMFCDGSEQIVLAAPSGGRLFAIRLPLVTAMLG